MNLPYSEKLPIHHLASCFRNRSTPYKFYWLISILQNVEQGKVVIYKKELFAGMIANAWYTVNYFKVSFGKQDKMQDHIEKLMKLEAITIDAKRDRIISKLLSSQSQQTLKILRHFDANVPHWFLSPWFRRATKLQIYSRSNDIENGTLYSLHVDRIEINPKWIEYLKHFAGIIKDFCYWNLAIYLQSHNPNVPDLPNKLIKPPIRGNLNSHRNSFWNMYFDEVGEMECIYSKKILTKSNYAVEHFIPHSFVSHDLNWNLIPADPCFNSRKNNYLPKLTEHFEAFYKVQCDAIEVIKSKEPRNKFLQDYIVLLGSFEKFEKIRALEIKKIYRESLDSLISIASFNGFQFLE
jgi:hypothetical protein